MTKAEKIKIKQQFETFMDNRDNVYKILEEFEKKHKFIPEKYQGDHKFMAAYAEYKITGGWRKNGIAKLIIKKAIKKAIKNNGRGINQKAIEKIAKEGM
jgi:hypothetical protein